MNITHKKKFLCPNCPKTLSSKQRVNLHMSSKRCIDENPSKKQKIEYPHLENRSKLDMAIQVLSNCKTQNFDAEKTK
jgi:hypothetical protein